MAQSPPITREQFIAEVAMAVVNSHDPKYDQWAQSIDYDGLRRRLGLLYDRLVTRGLGA